MAYSGGPSSDIKFTVDTFDIADANYLGKEVTVVRLRNRVLSAANFTAKKEIHAIDAQNAAAIATVGATAKNRIDVLVKSNATLCTERDAAFDLDRRPPRRGAG
jgi:hypothetical protein